MRILLNAAMLFERERFLNAAPYERTADRRDYCNGFKPKRLRTRLGELDLRIPQVRGSDFYPQALEGGSRSERALKLSLAEMYVLGVSTRKVKAITEQLCGFEVTSSQLSRATAELDEHFKQWRERPLRPMPYLQVDARYEKVREGGLVIDEAVLTAEIRIKNQIFEGKFGKAAGERLFSDYVEKSYISRTKANKRSWRIDLCRLKPLLAFFGKKRLCEISPFLIEKYKIQRRNTPGSKQDKRKAEIYWRSKP